MGSSLPVPGLNSVAPLQLDQARALVAASTAPMLVVDVTDGGFVVLGCASLYRPLIVGARHPSGPIPGETLQALDFGVLGEAISAAVADPATQQSFELPVGDDPTWYDVVVSALGQSGLCEQVIVTASRRLSDADIKRDRLRGERRRDALARHSPALGFVIDGSARIHSCSDSVTRVLGVPAAELAGRPLFTLLHPRCSANALGWFDAVRSTPGEPVTLSDIGFVHADGTLVWCDGSACNLLHDPDVAAIVVSAWDVTERRTAEAQLRLDSEDWNL